MVTLFDYNIEKIAQSLGKATKNNKGWACICPIHDDHKPSLSIWLSDRYPIGLKCYIGCNPGDIYNEIRARGLLPQSTRDSTRNFQPQREYGSSKELNFASSDNAQLVLIAKAAKVAKASQDFKIQNRALSIWNESTEIAGTIVKTYLRSRNITIPVDYFTLRYHASLWNEQQYFPGMIGAVKRWPGNDVIAIHRTFLKQDGSGKANIPSPKKMLGPVTGGAIRFGNNLSHIIVAEGVETALSVYQETGITTWAALSSTNIPTLILPPLEITPVVTIALDNDPSGIKCAERAAKYWVAAGRTIKWALPPKGFDFNDLLREIGDDNAT